MLKKIVTKIFGSRNDRYIKLLRKEVEIINRFEAEYQKLSDSELKSKTEEFRKRLTADETLDDVLNEAFAAVREASVRVMGMRHYDVQLIGAMVLNKGKISEMRTGEGKTLMSTLAAYLNALPANGVHVVTVNDYLASRDAKWMEPLYNSLDMTVGVIVSEMSHESKKAAYAADITYGTNNEYGFDYLRDNMAFSMDDKVQRSHSFAIIDEVDSILIDEARTPLIISGPADESSEFYQSINEFIPSLVKQEEEDGPGDYTVEEKNKQIFLTEDGHQNVEDILIQKKLLQDGESLYDAANIALMHHITAGLRAHVLFSKDVDYIVSNNEIVIVDEFTGRTMPGRRWSDGLHQAIEAKERVSIQQENQTLASITFQNYFRIYNKLSGMTGTADTEAYEFQSIYGLEVVVIPTDKPMIREDHVDQIYLTAKEKFNAIMQDIQECQKKGQPVLVGTASIEVSEYLSDLLKKNNIKHEVLNAKQHEREADIIAQAGNLSSVTIATNMAGRGTDIVLGGNLDVELSKNSNVSEIEQEKIKHDWQIRHDSVLQNGGLHIVGTERHESRRIDNQLRGRSGRQGDAGSSRFYLSLEDSLMRIFASDKISSLMQRLGMEEGEAIEHPWVSKAIENAQRKVEGHNFDMRKQLLEYDDVANDQRKVIYQQRNELMQDEDVSSAITQIRADVIHNIIDGYVPPNSMEEQWDIPNLEEALNGEFAIQMNLQSMLKDDDKIHEEILRRAIIDESNRLYQAKEDDVGAEVLRYVEKQIMLQVLDREWKEHLATMDYLRQGIHLRGYAQKNPKQEYKRESFQMFSDMLDAIKHEVATVMSKIQIRSEQDAEAVEAQRRAQEGQMEFQHADTNAMPLESESNEQPQPYVRDGKKVGRNEPCPCGSGKKFKQCHGKL